jgi:hypothetical protein
MKKIILSVGMALTFNNALAQWKTTTIDNGFDAPTKIAYTEDGQRPFLKLEAYEGKAVLIFKGVYFCDSPIFVEMSYQVNGENKKYGAIAELNDAETTAFISWDLKNEDYYADFKSCTSVKIRITDTGACSGDNDIYTFKMTGSTNAINFVTNQK